MALRTISTRNALHGVRPLRSSALRSNTRQFAATPLAKAGRDAVHRDEMLVDYQENSKSSYDGQAARTQETAFTKGRNAPHEQLEDAEHESKKGGHGNNPLDVSPANREVSRMTGAHVGTNAKQSRGPGQESNTNRPPKRQDRTQFDPSPSSSKEGSGMEQTRQDEKPGPAFAGTRGR